MQAILEFICGSEIIHGPGSFADDGDHLPACTDSVLTLCATGPWCLNYLHTQYFMSALVISTPVIKWRIKDILIDLKILAQ